MRFRFTSFIAFLAVTLVEAAQPVTDITDHWAFEPPLRPKVPEVSRQSIGSMNPIDAFIISRLDQEGLTPSAETDRYTLIRRVSLDLTGLPPSIAEVDAFVNDRRPNAYTIAVERLLDSPRHGERWARWWLDVARYADSNGYSIDAPRAMWLYRDWVINAINRDLPFDQFVIEQLAGDMLPEASVEQKIATGFHRNTQINQEGGIDKEQFRVESIIDRLATTGTAFLGLTIACAQCHAHKYDPITHEEYYRLFAFFNNQDEPKLELPNPKLDHAALDADQASLTDELSRHLAEAAARIAKEENELTPKASERHSKSLRAALKVPAAERTFKQHRVVYLALGGNDQEFKAKEARLSELENGRARLISTLVMAEREKPRETYVHIKGDFTRKGEQVLPGVPSALHEFPDRENPNRLDFARWLVSRENPLLARVIVNRVWQQYFGKGIVETENDFGTQGLSPSHPQLLDWLAVEFMESGWSLKRLHRLIVTSSTYRQSSKVRPDVAMKDPGNKLLARQNRLRLDAELVRDVGLAISGLLTGTIGGPSVHPPQPEGVMSLGQVQRQWKTDINENRYRRGMYTFFFRATPHPALAVFDAPDSFSACSRRPRSNTPLQALTLLNDEGFFEFARNLANRVLDEAPEEDAKRLDHVFRLCLSRPPQPREIASLKALLDAERKESGLPEEGPWISVARVMLNLDETITRE